MFHAERFLRPGAGGNSGPAIPDTVKGFLLSPFKAFQAKGAYSRLFGDGGDNVRR